jgi:hypothetical protein
MVHGARCTVQDNRIPIREVIEKWDVQVNGYHSPMPPTKDEVLPSIGNPLWIMRHMHVYGTPLDFLGPTFHCGSSGISIKSAIETSNHAICNPEPRPSTHTYPRDFQVTIDNNWDRGNSNKKTEVENRFWNFHTSLAS